MLILLLAISTFTARADEGFYSTPPASTLMTAWNATLLFYAPNPEPEINSAVVVGQDKDGLILLTVNHGLGFNCATGTCGRIQVARNVEIKWKDRARWKGPSIATRLEVIDRNFDNDMALLRMRTTERIEPMKIASSCTSSSAVAYAIGFPTTPKRTLVEKITDSTILRKRWSIGHTISRAVLDSDGDLDYGKTSGATVRLVATTDAIPGNSGGPLVDESGNLMGLVDRSGSLDDNYYGRGQAEKLQRNAVAIPCEVVRAYVSAKMPR